MTQGKQGPEALAGNIAVDFCLVNDAQSHHSIDFLT